MGIKVLFVYPNTYGMNMLPPAIAMFSALLKKNGHKIKIFDTTYYAMDYGIDSDGSKMERLNVVPYSMDKKGIRLKTSDWKKDLKKLYKDSELNKRYCGYEKPLIKILRNMVLLEDINSKNFYDYFVKALDKLELKEKNKNHNDSILEFLAKSGIMLYDI